MMEFKHTHTNFKGDVESEITYTILQDCSLHDVMQEFRCFLLAVSYSPEGVSKYIPEE